MVLQLLGGVARRGASRVRAASAVPASARALSGAPVADLGYTLTEDQRSFQEVARNFAKNEIIPVAAEFDRSMAFPADLFKQAWELGLVNTHIGEEYGGLGLDTFSNVVIQEELGKLALWWLVARGSWLVGWSSEGRED